MSAEIKTFAQISVGDTVQFEVTIDEKAVADFAALSGDYSPLHMDKVFASSTPLGQRIAHGMLGASYFSRIVGMHLPGTHALYLSQTLSFKKPILLGTVALVSGEVTQKVEALQVIKLRLSFVDKTSGDTLVEGDAMVKVLQ